MLRQAPIIQIISEKNMQRMREARLYDEQLRTETDDTYILIPHSVSKHKAVSSKPQNAKSATNSDDMTIGDEEVEDALQKITISPFIFDESEKDQYTKMKKSTS